MEKLQRIISDIKHSQEQKSCDCLAISAEFENLKNEIKKVGQLEKKINEISRAIIAMAHASQAQQNNKQEIIKTKNEHKESSFLQSHIVKFFISLFTAITIIMAIFFYIDSQSAKNINVGLNKIEKIEKYISTNSHAKIKSPYNLPENFQPASLRDAAIDGIPLAMFEVAVRYYNSKQEKQAVKWFKYAAQKENPPAQYALAVLYEKGIGTKKQTNKAIYWYEKSAKNGNVKSMYNLAVMKTGAVEKNLATAFFWFTKAAEYGMTDSQYNLALMYQYGKGVKKSYTEAFKWFSLAAQSGDKIAEKELANLKIKMNQQEIDIANVKLSNWQKKEINIKANQAKIPDKWKI